MLDSIGAELRFTSAGKIWFQLIDDNHTSEVGFTPSDDIKVMWKSGPDAVERPNICRVSYYSRERDFDIAEIDMTGIAWARISDEIDRYGPKPLDIELPFCPSASQAQRIARRMFAQARGDTGSITTNMVGIAAWGRLYATVTLPDLGDVLPVKIEPPRVDDASGSVEIPFSVWPTLATWNPAVDEASAPDAIPDLSYQGDMPRPSAPTAALQITYPGGAKEFRVGYSLPPVDYDTIEATYRSYLGGLPDAWNSMTETSTFAYASADVQTLQVDSRVRIFEDDEGSNFSSPYSVVVGVSNAACGQPAHISGGVTTTAVTTHTLSITVSASELRVASIRLDRRLSGGAWVQRDIQNARPGQTRSFSDVYVGGPTAVEWRVVSVTSNGTDGTARVYTPPPP